MAKEQTSPHDAPAFEPFNVELEQALIGLALINPNTIAFMQAELAAADFFDPMHQRLIERIFAKYESDLPVNPLSLNASLKNDVGLRAVGGMTYLANCAQAAPSAATTDELHRIVRNIARSVADLRVRRDAERAIADSNDMLRAGKPIDEAMVPVVELADFENERMEHRYGAVTIAEAGDALMREIERPEDEALPAAPTGIGLLNDIIGGYFCANLIVVGGRPGMGKAQPLSAPILLENGEWRAIGKLRRGTRLASIDGGPNEVTAVHERGERIVYRVSFSDGRSTECCADHLWRVRSRHWGSRVVSTSKLEDMLQSKRHRGRLSVDLVSGDFGSARALPVDPYLLGLLLGDGDISRLRKPVLTSADGEILQEAALSLGLFGAVTQRGKYAFALGSGGKRGKRGEVGWLPRALDSLGLIGSTSETKFVPPAYKSAPRSSRLALLQGLMDTDGWAEKEGAVRFSTCSRLLALDVQYLVRSLGGLCSIKERRTSYVSRGTKKASALQFTCKIRHPSGETFFRLERKAARARRGHNATVRLSVVSVVPSRVTETRCISVSHPSRLYVTEDFIVTHNSIVGELAARVAAASGFSVDYFDLENKTGVLTARMLCDLDYDRAFRDGRPPIHYSRVHLRRLSNDEKGWIAEANLMLRELDIDVHDRDELTIAQVASICRAKAARTKKPKLFIIDHMHLIEPSNRYAGRKVDEISEVTKGAKRLAKRLDSSVLLLAQLNRDLERRDDKRPTMADFRESGSIEQDADVMIGLNRPHYHLERSRPKSDATEVDKGKHSQELVRSANVLELGILKNRHGRTGEIAVYVDVASSAIRDEAPTAQTQIDFANLPAPPAGQRMF